MKIVKNHTKIQIHEFPVPQLLVLRDSEKIRKNLISGPKFDFSGFLGYLGKIPEIFPNNLDFPEKRWKSSKITEECKSMNF